MAECHPVGFQWVVEAKARGATRDPRRSPVHPHQRAGRPARAAAGRGRHRVPGRDHQLRPGQREVLPRLRAWPTPMPPSSSARTSPDTEDLDGVFAGLDAESAPLRQRRLAVTRAAMSMRRRAARPVSRRPARTSSYARLTERGAQLRRRRRRPRPRSGPSPSSIRAACSRSSSGTSPGTPRRSSSRPAGCRRTTFARVCELLTANSGRDRTTAFVYSVGWTQHTVGRAVRPHRGDPAGRCSATWAGPGGGILALRGHASIQGSTDIPTLFDLLPGYLPMPHAHEHQDLDAYVRRDRA